MTQTQIEGTLRRAGLLQHGEHATIEPLTGGVSSLILRAELPDGRQVCIKKALPKLKVADNWEADPARNAAERASLEVYSKIVPGSTPEVLYEDPVEQLFIMEYLGRGHTWKDDLLNGRIDPIHAARAGRILGLVHAQTANRTDLASRFANHELFDQLRLDPYLRTTGRRHPDLAPAIDRVTESLDRTRMCLVHGDFSPKNILITDEGRLIVLDHEVAVFGDPAFDVAFLLNHLCLKGVCAPNRVSDLVNSIQLFWTTYKDITQTTGFDQIERRVARLLPILMLARIDGKSSVEYLDEGQRASTRDFARGQIQSGGSMIRDFLERFIESFVV